MEFKHIETENEARAVFPIMQQLREHLDLPSYLKYWLAAREQSQYRLMGAFSQGRYRALMGYRILTDFVHGRHLYIDDLVVTQMDRSNGLGTELLRRAKVLAIEAGCSRLRLCTGIENTEGQRFYERNGLELRAVVYKTKTN